MPASRPILPALLLALLPAGLAAQATPVAPEAPPVPTVEERRALERKLLVEDRDLLLRERAELRRYVEEHRGDLALLRREARAHERALVDRQREVERTRELLHEHRRRAELRHRGVVEL